MDSSLHHQPYPQDEYLSSLPLNPMGLPSFLRGDASPSASQDGAARGAFAPTAGSEAPLVPSPLRRQRLQHSLIYRPSTRTTTSLFDNQVTDPETAEWRRTIKGGSTLTDHGKNAPDIIKQAIA